MIKVKYFNDFKILSKHFLFNPFGLEYELERPNLKYVKLQFNAPVFDKVTKDRSAKFVDQWSAIGGTMGLLTGFSIISGVEIVYFVVKIAIGYLNESRQRKLEKKSIQ